MVRGFKGPTRAGKRALSSSYSWFWLSCRAMLALAGAGGMTRAGHGGHAEDCSETPPAVLAFVFAFQGSFVWCMLSTARAVGMARTRLSRQRLEAGHFTAAIHANVFCAGVALQKRVLAPARSQRMPGAWHGEERPLVGESPAAKFALDHFPALLEIE